MASCSLVVSFTDYTSHILTSRPIFTHNSSSHQEYSGDLSCVLSHGTGYTLITNQIIDNRQIVTCQEALLPYTASVHQTDLRRHCSLALPVLLSNTDPGSLSATNSFICWFTSLPDIFFLRTNSFWTECQIKNLVTNKVPVVPLKNSSLDTVSFNSFTFII